MPVPQGRDFSGCPSVCQCYKVVTFQGVLPSGSATRWDFSSVLMSLSATRYGLWWVTVRLSVPQDMDFAGWPSVSQCHKIWTLLCDRPSLSATRYGLCWVTVRLSVPQDMDFAVWPSVSQYHKIWTLLRDRPSLRDKRFRPLRGKINCWHLNSLNFSLFCVFQPATVRIRIRKNSLRKKQYTKHQNILQLYRFDTELLTFPQDLVTVGCYFILLTQ